MSRDMKIIINAELSVPNAFKKSFRFYINSSIGLFTSLTPNLNTISE